MAKFCEYAMIYILYIADKVEKAFIKGFPYIGGTFALLFAAAIAGGSDTGILERADAPYIIIVALVLVVLTLIWKLKKRGNK